jgi:hypothetical protein
MSEPSSPIPDGPTEAEVTAEMVDAANDTVVDWVGHRLSPAGIRDALTAALAVSPHREQVQKLTEENERLLAALKLAVVDYKFDHPWPSNGVFNALTAALSSYKGEQ